MEAYDELASSSESSDHDYSCDELTSEDDEGQEDEDEDEDEDDADDPLYKPSPGSKQVQVRPPRSASSRNCHAETENKDPLFSNLLRDNEYGKKVTVEQCKDFLRKHGLRVSGIKSVLIDRIRGHLEEKETNVNVECGDSSKSRGLAEDSIVDQFKDMNLNNKASIESPEEANKLTVENCKAYLRKHGLRLTGTKQVLIERIKEHSEIKDGQGRSKYPEASFTVDCQGDACVGDVVLFKQKVYDSSFNVGGRCAAGPPVGIRTIAGRIIKDSYGSAKQQHTFTVEVLWSTGERPLPPLHPLIIKGRNLYRVKTLRQAWINEIVRTQKIMNKHARGAAARKARLERMKNGGRFTAGTHKAVVKSDKLCREQMVASSVINGGIIARAAQSSVGAHNTSINPSNNIGSAAFTGLKQPINMELLYQSNTAVRAGQMVNQLCDVSAQMLSVHCDPPRRDMSKNINRIVDVAAPTAANYLLPQSVDAAISSVEFRFKRTLAGLIVGKQGAHINKLKSISLADVKIDTQNPEICIVTITGTASQREVASRMLYARVSCRFFASIGNCLHGEACKFLHSSLE